MENFVICRERVRAFAVGGFPGAILSDCYRNTGLAQSIGLEMYVVQHV